MCMHEMERTARERLSDSSFDLLRVEKNESAENGNTLDLRVQHDDAPEPISVQVKIRDQSPDDVMDQVMDLLIDYV